MNRLPFLPVFQSAIVLQFALMLCLLIAASCTSSEHDQVARQTTLNELIKGEAVCYGGFRHQSRDTCPTVDEIMEDMRIAHALGFRWIRTYHTSQFPHAERTLQAIETLRQENNHFQMNVMLGAWVECQGAWSDHPNHSEEHTALVDLEIQKAVALANQFPEIVKVIAVGNESMVHWAPYHVSPNIVLERVQQLKALRAIGKLPKHLLITSSDNFAAWGGGSEDYHQEALEALIREVDYVSMHTYPFHDTHYNPEFWHRAFENKNDDPGADSSFEMKAAVEYAIKQYQATLAYVHAVDQKKRVHIGETGWASVSTGFYGPDGSCAASPIRQAAYLHGITAWAAKHEVACFFFELFDEPWKDPNDRNGSENHFGLITKDGGVKAAMHDRFEQIEGMNRGLQPIRIERIDPNAAREACTPTKKS